MRFGTFTFDPITLELFDRGEAVPLARQPALLLSELLAHEGELVSREQISESLWPGDTHVESDLGINNSVRRLRRALGDSPQNPRYIETLAGLGYRFCCPLEIPAEPEASHPTVPLQTRRVVWLGLGLVSLFLAVTDWSLRGSQSPAASSEPVTDSPAHGEYLNALFLLNSVPTEELGESSRIEEHLAQAIDLLEEGLEKDPLYAPAWVALSKAHMWTGAWLPASTWGPPAIAAAERALEVDPLNAAAHAALAGYCLHVNYDLVRGLKEAELAVKLGPTSSAAQQALAGLLAASGRLEEAIVAIERARELNPGNASISVSSAYFRFLAGRLDEAVTVADQVLVVKPREPAAHFLKIRIAMLRGDEASAVAQASQFARGFVAEGSRVDYRTLREFWLDVEKYFESGEHVISSAPWWRSLAALNQGRRHAAAAILLDACRRGEGNAVVFARLDPDLGDLEGEPDFEEFLLCMSGAAG